jgi:hypothetical protein
MSLITIFDAKEFEVTRLYLSPESYLTTDGNELRGGYNTPCHATKTTSF